MAHLNEKNQLVGSLGNLVFKLVKGKVIVQTKPEKRNITQTDHSKKAALDFGKASNITKKLNSGMQEFLQSYHSPDMFNRLRARVLRAMRAQSPLPLGEKDLWNGMPQLLEGFEFNSNSKYEYFSDLWVVNWQMDQQYRIHFQQKAFIPKSHLRWLPHTEHLEVCYWISAFQKKDDKPVQQQLLKMKVYPVYIEVPEQSFTSTSFPTGSLIIISAGLLYYKQDPVLGKILLNHKSCHPVQVLKVLKIE